MNKLNTASKYFTQLKNSDYIIVAIKFVL